METIRILNLAISLTGIVLCGIGILQMLLGQKAFESMVKYMLPTYVCLIVFAASNLAGQLMRGHPGGGYRAGLYLSNFLEFLSPAWAAYIMSRYLLAIVDPQKKWRNVRAVQLVPVLAFTVLLIVSQFTGFFYIINAENVYQRSAWYPISQALVAILLVTDIVILFHDKEVLTQKEAVAFSIYFMVPFLSTVMQAFIYGIYLNILATSIAVLAMHVFLFTEQTERYYRQVEENARQREENAKQQIQIMLSQIQPHFLYNTLGAIGRLCQDAPEGKEAIYRFSHYLRSNMASINQTAPIPFNTELEHTRTYLELELLRFKDKLRVAYDIEATEFMLPTLTLQPIAENAVLHGVRCNPDGRGTVTISSREYPDHWEVLVSDDGPGFDPAVKPNDDKLHIGIENVRNRLEQLCGGELWIDSAPGQGCRVTITIPRK